jgi:hypothetical protein
VSAVGALREKWRTSDLLIETSNLNFFMKRYTKQKLPIDYETLDILLKRKQLRLRKEAIDIQKSYAILYQRTPLSGDVLSHIMSYLTGNSVSFKSHMMKLKEEHDMCSVRFE